MGRDEIGRRDKREVIVRWKRTARKKKNLQRKYQSQVSFKRRQQENIEKEIKRTRRMK